MIWLFAKKVKLLDTNSLDELHAKEKTLKNAGIRSNSWSTQEPPVLGGEFLVHTGTACPGRSAYENQRLAGLEG